MNPQDTSRPAAVATVPQKKKEKKNRSTVLEYKHYKQMVIRQGNWSPSWMIRGTRDHQVPLGRKEGRLGQNHTCIVLAQAPHGGNYNCSACIPIPGDWRIRLD